MATSLLHVSVPEFRDHEIVYRGELHAPGRPAVAVEFRASIPSPASERVPMRAFLFAFLIPAMRLGTALRLPQPIDAVTWGNMMEWQEAMASWHPRALRVVPVLADIELGAPQASEARGAITAFSGGVDSCFTAFRHTAETESPRYRRAELRAGLMIQGFDIPFTDDATFESAWQNSAALLEAFGLQAYRLKTNLRSLEAAFGCGWETEAHGIWLAAALACCEPAFDRVLIPSTYVYPKLKLPWGTNPVTDPLFSSDRVAYWHDGAAFTKFLKVQAMVAHGAVQQRLRVCWQGPQLDRNCGRCFKCVATQVCFWLAGVPEPPAFPRRATLDDVARLPVKNEENAYLVRHLRAVARGQGRIDLDQALGRAMQRAAWVRTAKRLKRSLRAALSSRPEEAGLAKSPDEARNRDIGSPVAALVPPYH